MNIAEIHESLVNGQRQQMVEQINDYGLYDFFSDYEDYLNTLYANESAEYAYFREAVTSYHRITNR